MNGYALSLDTFNTLLLIYVLPVHGFDFILGLQWLKPWGKIMWEFAHLTMSITYQGTSYVLQGVQNMRIKTLDSHHMR